MTRMIFIFLAAACIAAASPDDRAPTTTSPAGTDDLATFGVAVRAPEGWHREWEGRADTVARWTNGSATARATGAITLELEPANGRTLAQQAEALRRRYRDANLGIHALVMGGQPAMRITGKDASGNASVDVLLALADRHFYTLSGYAAVPRLLPTEAMDEMARTIRFSPPTDPAAATALRAPLTFFGRFSIAPLATMRPGAEAPVSPRSLTLVTTDYRNQRPALSLEMQILPNPKRLPLIEMAAQVTQRLSRGQPLPWRTWHSPPRGVSDAFVPTPPDASNTTTRLGLVQLSEGELLYLNFSAGSDDPESRNAMEAACERILRSVEPRS